MDKWNWLILSGVCLYLLIGAVITKNRVMNPLMQMLYSRDEFDNNGLNSFMRMVEVMGFKKAYYTAYITTTIIAVPMEICDIFKRKLS